MQTKIKMEDGTWYRPKDTDSFECPIHGVKTTWGALDAIQQLAATESLDTTEDLPCLYAPTTIKQGG